MHRTLMGQDVRKLEISENQRWLYDGHILKASALSALSSLPSDPKLQSSQRNRYLNLGDRTVYPGRSTSSRFRHHGNSPVTLGSQPAWGLCSGASILYVSDPGHLALP